MGRMADRATLEIELKSTAERPAGSGAPPPPAFGPRAEVTQPAAAPAFGPRPSVVAPGGTPFVAQGTESDTDLYKFGQRRLQQMKALQEEQDRQKAAAKKELHRVEMESLKAQERAVLEAQRAQKERRDELARLEQENARERWQAESMIAAAPVAAARALGRVATSLTDPNPSVVKGTDAAADLVTALGNVPGLSDIPILGSAVKGLAAGMGELIRTVGKVNDQFLQTASQVRLFSPELMGASVRADMRRLRTDMEIAGRFGADMGRTVDANARLENAVRLIGADLAAAMSRSTNPILEKTADALEIIAAAEGPGNKMEAVAALLAQHLPFIGDVAKRHLQELSAKRDAANAQFAEQAASLIENFFKLEPPRARGRGEEGGAPRIPMPAPRRAFNRVR